MSVSDINDAGDVVGCAGMFVEPVFGHEVWLPFVYTNGEMRQLTDNWDAGTASTIRVRRLDSRIWRQHDARRLLVPERRAEEHRRVAGILNQPYTIGYGINNAGTIVGESKAEAMIYENGEMKGFGRHSARSAEEINDVGDIIGFLATPKNTHGGFLFRANQIKVIPGSRRMRPLFLPR